jgi:hypothetical protein
MGFKTGRPGPVIHGIKSISFKGGSCLTPILFYVEKSKERRVRARGPQISREITDSVAQCPHRTSFSKAVNFKSPSR